MGRLLALYLRSRHVPIAAPASIVAVALLTLAGNDPENPLQTVIFAILALALGFGVLGNGLGAADDTLERTASIRWPIWRAVHALVIGAVLFGAVALVTDAPVGLVVRGAVGFVGLTTLAAALFGGQLSWTLPIVWAGVAVVVPPMSTPPILALLTWPLQPLDSVGSWVLAIVLGLLGLTCYAWHNRTRLR